MKGRIAPLAREVIETVILAAVLFFAVRSVVLTYRVEQQSMEPTLYEGQYLVVLRVAYLDVGSLLAGRASAAEPDGHGQELFGSPQRGDIVVFQHGDDPDKHLVKRVIGLPGETVEVRGGSVLIDGRSLDEPYEAARPTYEMAKQTIPAGYYFVLGDNRNVSNDSHLFGPIPRSSIVGKAFPLPRWPQLSAPVRSAVLPKHW